jgi:polyferredoxin
LIVLLLVVLAALAAAMAASTALFVRWAAGCRSGLRAAIVVFLLLMMTGMLLGGLVYELRPDREGAVEGLWLASLAMSASVVVVFVAFLRAARQGQSDAGTPEAYRAGVGFVTIIAGLALLNEFLMGWTFGAATGAIPRLPDASSGAAAAFLAEVVVSPWFVLTMAGEMALTTFLLRGAFPRAVGFLLGAEAALMVASPPTFRWDGWSTGAIAASSAGMVVLFVFLMEHLYRHRELARGLATYVGLLLPVLAAMMAGIFLWQLYGTPALFAASVLAAMLLYFVAVVRPGLLGDREKVFRWQARPGWTTGLLASIFVAELFMGAALTAALEPGTYLASLSLLPLAGAPSTVLGDAAANGFSFVVNTTATTWFLAMMGAEMGALVVFKMREAHGRELRFRLALMLGCYGAFAVFYPSVYYGLLFPHAPGAASPTTVPVLGWSMGVGSAPLAAGVFGVVLATYAAFGAVTVLFGRRAVCSVFCTAAVMYQGTAIDAMKSFNRSSPVARKFLGSRLSTAYAASTAGVLVALAGTSVASYLDSTGRVAWTVGGEDPSVFLFALSFGVLWYALFVTIPYAGDYNCVTMGWCYTGQLSGLLSRVGLFHLRVKDPAVCRRCTTVDCARACPVGLVDMPGHFRTKGTFRSSKCCGIGGCAEACPYGNLYLADVRHALARRLGRRRPTGAGVELPMAGRPIPAGPVSASLGARPAQLRGET